MKKLITILLLLPILLQAQTINVRIYDGIDSFQNSFWNNWHPVHKPDTSAAFTDIFGNKTRIRAVISYFEQVYDNQANYLIGKSIFPDTVVRKGVYNSGLATVTLTGLDDSSTYYLILFASRNRADSQTTKYSIIGIPADTGSLNATMNAAKTVAFSGVVSTKGAVAIQLQNLQSFNYLNAFTLVGTPKHSPVKALIWADSTSIHYPRSFIKLTGSGSIGAMPYYTWSQTSGPASAIFNNFGDTMYVSGLIPGNYRFGLLVQDSIGNLDSAFVNITVNPFLCPICPACPPPITCPVCPACPVIPISGNRIMSWTVVQVGGIFRIQATYWDGTVGILP